MTRRTTVKKRITPRASSAKTIEAAREQILRIVPPGVRIHISAFWHDSQSGRWKSSRESYNVSIYSDLTGRELADLDATSPGGLVTAVMTWCTKPVQHDTPEPRPPVSQEMAVRRPGRNESRSSSGAIGHSVPRVGHHVPLLEYGGQS
jgi:hypothetical protein